MSDIHASIRAFLQQRSITVLPHAKDDTNQYLKAGIVPFQKKTPQELLFYVMKPQGTVPKLGAPPWQLCKGTRQHFLPSGGWQDMRHPASDAPDKESLIETALREGIEELGLILEHIGLLFDLGPYAFASATTGKRKQMWLFGAALSTLDVLPPAAVAATTADRAWQSASAFAVVGREDHRYILSDIEQKLLQAVS